MNMLITKNYIVKDPKEFSLVLEVFKYLIKK